MTRIVLALLALAMLFASSATAQLRGANYDETGGFLSLAGFNAFQQFDNKGTTNVDDSLGFSLSLGYRFHPRLSAELNWSMISGWELSDVEVPSGAPPVPDRAVQLEGGSFTGDIKGYLLTGRIQPYAQVGIGLMYARLATTFNVVGGCNWWYCVGSPLSTDSTVEFASRIGGGVDFWATPEWALFMNALYVIPTGSLSDLQYVQMTWGFNHRF